MEKSEIKERACSVLERAGAIICGDAKDTYRLKYDLAMDSLDLVEATMKLEEEFSISISDTEAEKIEKMTVGQLVVFLDKKINK